MYNQKIKQEFIEFKKKDIVDSENKGAWYFNRVERIEEYLDKDVSNFNVVEIVDYLKCLHTPSLEYLQVIKGYFEDYTRWAVQKGYVKDGLNHFEEVTVDILQKCINMHTLKKKVATKSQIMDTIDRITRPCDKFLCLAVFEGLGGIKYKEFWHLKASDFEGGYVNLCTGRKLKVSDELVKFAKISSETYEDGDVQHSFKEDDSRVLKARRNAASNETPPQLYRRVWLQLDRVSKEYGLYMSAKGLKESGRIEMIKNLRQEGESIEETYRKNLKEINARYGKENNIKQWVLQYEWAFEEES